MSRTRRIGWLPVLLLLLVALAVAGLLSGSVTLSWSMVLAVLDGSSQDPLARDIVREVRIPQLITAATAGAGLAACGLIMQTLFRNPLAGPSVLGISSGASLGVALVVLARPLLPALPVGNDLLLVLASLIGAFVVLSIILLADRRIGDGVVLLIVGLMVGHLCSAIIDVLQASSAGSALKGYISWGLGSFAGVGRSRIVWLWLPVVLGLLAALWLIKPLNALLLGDDHARSVGVPVGATRRWAILITGLLAGTVTAFCGPIAFLGLATPHLARVLVRTSDHAVLMPASILLGAVLALGCDLVVRSSTGGAAIPLNAVTSLLGAPVVLWVLLNSGRWTGRDRA